MLPYLLPSKRTQRATFEATILNRLNRRVLTGQGLKNLRLKTLNRAQPLKRQRLFDCRSFTTELLRFCNAPETLSFILNDTITVGYYRTIIEGGTLSWNSHIRMTAFCLIHLLTISLASAKCRSSAK